MLRCDLCLLFVKVTGPVDCVLISHLMSQVVMVKGQTALDMRGRCSAGQKVGFVLALLLTVITQCAILQGSCIVCSSDILLSDPLHTVLRAYE